MADKSNTCCFTGHRVINSNEYSDLSESLEREILRLYNEYGVRNFIAGGATGFDMLAELVVLKLRSTYPDIRLFLFLPCRSQSQKWDEESVFAYNKILSLCDKSIYTSEEYSKGCFILRNKRMVECSGYCISYKRRESGGTAFTVGYAKKRGIEIISL